MAQSSQKTRVFIVGDLPNRPERAALLRDLTAREPGAEWEWIQPTNDQFSLPPKYLGRLLHTLRSGNKTERIVVVKLALIHGKDMNALYQAHPDPMHAPHEIQLPTELADWLLSAEAGIIPPKTWWRFVRQAALLAVISKLVRNKSWNKDTQGHAWTKEIDLLGQAPVNRPEFQQVYGEACELIERTAGTLLLTKGGKQGKTPKEWSINTDFLPSVKRALIERSCDPFREVPELTGLMSYVDRGPEVLVEIDSVVVSQRVISVCVDR